MSQPRDKRLMCGRSSNWGESRRGIGCPGYTSLIYLDVKGASWISQCDNQLFLSGRLHKYGGKGCQPKTRVQIVPQTGYLSASPCILRYDLQVLWSLSRRGQYGRTGGLIALSEQEQQMCKSTGKPIIADKGCRGTTPNSKVCPAVLYMKKLNEVDDLDYDEKALIYAERYGIIDYKVSTNTMTYTETFPSEGSIYEVSVNLTTMKESRIQKTQTV